MKTKIVITDIVSFVLGILLFFIAFSELLLFCATSDPNNLSILFLSFSLGLRHMQDSTAKINKEENDNEK